MLVDDDAVELSNLNRQLLFRRSDVGRPKVEAAAEAVRSFNPAARVLALRRRVTGPAAAAECVEGALVVVETADWPPYEIARWIDAACVERGIAHLAAGQMPPLVRVGPLFVPGVTACFGCQERRARRAFPFYDALVAFRRDRVSPATTLGPASGVIGSLIAMEVVHLLTGARTPATLGRALVLDLATGETRFDPVAPDPECDCQATGSTVAGGGRSARSRGAAIA